MSQRREPGAGSARMLMHPTAQGAAPSPVVAEVERLARHYLEPCLREFLTLADDELFERAERAASGDNQQRLFDGMRVLRMARSEVTRRFFAELRRGFRPQKNRGGAGSEDDPHATGAERSERLTLVDDEDLEERVGLDTLVTRVEAVQPLLQLLLTRRLRYAMALPRANGIDHSLAPSRLAACIASALSELEFSALVRVVLYKLFERQLTAYAERLYVAVNRHLVENEVLPTLSQEDLRQSRAQSSSTTSERPYSDHAPEAQLGQPLGDTLPGLAARRRFATQDSGDGGRAPTVGELVSFEELLQLVDHQRLPEIDISGDRNLDVLPSTPDLGDLLTEGARAEGVDAPQFRTADEDVINLIQMLFDFILSDRQLATPMKALLARLQMPLLRLGLADREFFRQPTHPARVLLNTLTEAGFSWTRSAEAQRDQRYAGIERIVMQVIQNFEGEVGLFTELTDELEALMRADAEQTARVSQRTIDNEHARIEAERTRRLIQNLIDHRCSKIQTVALERFLRDHWQQVLLRRYRLEGSQSAPWREALAALRCLTSGSGLSVDELNQALINGLHGLGFDDDRARREAAEVIAHFSKEFFERMPDRSEPKPFKTDGAREATPGSSRAGASLAESLPSRRFIDQAAALEPGAWVEVRDGEMPQVRCRLASITEPPERCIFLNRRGLKIKTLSRLELASALETGGIALLDDSQLFERALSTVLTELRATAG